MIWKRAGFAVRVWGGSAANYGCSPRRASIVGRDEGDRYVYALALTAQGLHFWLVSPIDSFMALLF
jgi:hypothetical protein